MNLIEHAGLYVRIKNAVLRTTPHQAQDLEEVLTKYNGDPRLLSLFLDRFQSDNPYEAASSVALRRAIFRTSIERKKEGLIHGKSESGHKLTEQMFVLAHKYDPSREWVSGSQAIIKIMETFGTADQQETFSPRGKKKINKEKKRQLQESMHEFVQTLDEVLQDHSRIADVQSRNDRLQVQKILQLDDALRERIAKLDALVYGNTAFVDSQVPSYLLSLEPGGMLFGWFKRKIASLPMEIRDIYTSVTNPYLEIPEDQRRFFIGSLIAYAAMHMPVNKTSAIGGYQQDLEFILQLPDDHPIIKDPQFGRPDLSAVRTILEKEEITLIDAARIFTIYPVDKVRSKLNREHVEKYVTEYTLIIERLCALFIYDGKCVDDCLGSSVPMKRLSKTLYAAALTRNDFAAVMDMLRLVTIAGSEDNFYKALPIAEFKRNVDQVVIAARKIKRLDALLTEKSIKIADPEHAGELPSELHNLAWGNDINLVENFEQAYGLSVSDFIARVDYVHRKRHWIWSDVKKVLTAQSAYGLCSLGQLKKVLELLPEAKELISYDKIREQIETAAVVLGNPLLKAMNWKHSISVNSGGFTDKTIYVTFGIIAQLSERLKQAEQVLGQDSLDALLQQRHQLKAQTFYAGNLDTGVIVNRIFYDLQEPVEEFAGFKFLDTQKLPAYVQRFATEFIGVEELSAKWLQRLRFLVNREAAELLKKVQLRISDTQSWKNAKDLREKHYVQRSFAQDVSTLYQRLTDSWSFAQSVMTEGIRELRDAQLYTPFTVCVTGTQYGDADRFNWAFPELTYQVQGHEWRSKKPVVKGAVGQMTERLKQYNQQYHKDLKMVVCPVSEIGHEEV